MHTPARDDSTRELMQTRLRLRDGLFARPESTQDGSGYRIEDAERGRFYRVGADEYSLLSRLDGATTLGEAVSLTSRQLGPDAFTEQQAMQIATWLLESKLVESVDECGRAGQRPVSSRTARNAGWSRWNPFWLRCPLGNPDRFVQALLPLLGWIHSPPAVLASVVLWLFALAAFGTHWNEFAASARAVLAPGNWLSLGLAWLVLKTLHEVSHALACRRYGGEVREAGIVFVLFAPLAFVDVTSSWRLKSKWQRIHVAAAGMMLELTLASLAILGWVRTYDPAVRHLLHNMVLMASVSTLLFNINPLMRFDGYYILSDLLEIPNLYARSRDSVNRIARRLILGLKTGSVREAGLEAWCLRAYGVLAFGWRIVVCAGLAIAASVLLEGLGILLSIAGIAVWIGRPLARLIGQLKSIGRAEPARLLRAAICSSFAVACLVAVLSWIPWPAGRTAPGLVELQEFSVVRADAPGFVRAIHITNGQQVEAGELLIELENQELQTELACLRIDAAQSEKRQQRFLRNGETVAAQIESDNRFALRQRIAQKQREAETLRVYAPRDGRIAQRQLKWLTGTYVETGQELLFVGDDHRKEFRASLSQQDADAISGGPGEVRIRLHSRTPVTAQLHRIEPRARKTPLDSSLTVPAGGRLAVRPVESSGNGDDHYELIEPRFTAEFSLPGHLAESVPAGTRGEVTLRPRQYDSLGEGLYRTTTRWVEDRLAAALGEAK